MSSPELSQEYEKYAKWEAPTETGNEGFMSWGAEKGRKIFKALLPTAGLWLLAAGSRVEASNTSSNAAAERIKLRTGIEMAITRDTIKYFRPELVQREIIDGKEHERINAEIRLGDKLFDFYSSSPVNLQELNTKDHLAEAQLLYKDYKDKLGKRYPKKESLLKKVFRVATSRVVGFFGDPSEKNSTPKVGNVPLEDARVYNLVDAVGEDMLAVHDTLEGNDKKMVDDVMRETSEYELRAAREATANFYKEAK